MASLAVRLGVVLGCLTAVACGGSDATMVPAAAPVSPRAAPASAGTAADHAVLSRASVHEAIAMGLGVFLQSIQIDDQPVRVAGKFHGFRIAALSDAPFWSAVDLKPGDVVTAVNGMPIERPEQAEAAFEALDGATELHVSCERDGQPHDLVLAIVP